MTEAEWLASDDPQAMLAAILPTRSGDVPPVELEGGIGNPSDRKLRLFAREAAILWCADRSHWDRWVENPEPQEFDSLTAARYQLGIVTERGGWIPVTPDQLRERVHLLREVVGNPYRPVTLPARPHCQSGCPGSRRPDELDHRLPRVCPDCGHYWECPWLTWRDCTVPRLARTIYDGRQWEQMPILGDALQEAGCDNADILAHCRGQERCTECHGTGIFPPPGAVSPDPSRMHTYSYCSSCGGKLFRRGTGWIPLRGPHCRGCWVLDLLLGLS